MCFVSNQGQTDAKVKFVARGQGYSLFLTPTEAVLRLRGGKDGGRNEGEAGAGALIRSEPTICNPQSASLRMRFAGANPGPDVRGADELAGKVNCFKGVQPRDWRTNLPVYSKVKYTGVYPGVDLVFYGSEQGRLEFDWVVAPGADPEDISLALEGANRVTVEETGDLTIQAGGGEIRQHRPIIYQWVDGARRAVDGGFLVTEAAPTPGRDKARERCWLVSFNIAAYNKALPLVIDPVLSYSTFLGGSGNDSATGIAVDQQGNVYITGSTDSLDFPIHNPIASGLTNAGRDAFVVKLNPQGSGFVYATYFGGSPSATGRSIAVDAAGNAYITGDGSGNLPVVNAFQSTCAGCWDAFLAKFSADGSALLYSTYLGGDGCDSGASVAVDAQQNAFVTGNTSSPNWPTRNAVQADFHGGGPDNLYNYKGDAFVAKIDTTLPGDASLIYSTFLGGGDDDATKGIAVDGAGNAYVTGYTASTNFPTTGGAFQTSFAGGDYDAFVAMLNPLGTALVYSTYLGGSASDDNAGYGGGIAVDEAGNAYVTGQTGSSDFPTENAWQPTKTSRWTGVGGTGFVSKLNPDGSDLVYSTFLLGVGYTGGIAVDPAGCAHLTGIALGDFATVNAVQSNYLAGGNWDGFVLKLDPDGQSALYATFLGGSQGASGMGIAVDGKGNAYVTGSTSSTNFPTQNALQAAFGGGSGDAFVAKISDPDTNPPAILAASNYGDASVVTVDFSEALDVNSATNPTHYALDHEVTVSSVTMGVNSRTVRLLTSGLTNGVTYTLTVSGVLDRAPVPNPIAQDTHFAFTALGLYRGFLHQEVYAGIDGENLADLTNNAKFPNQPDISNSVHQSEILSHSTSQSGSRLTGYLIPPVTGDYAFYLCTERQGILFLSRNESPLNAVQIAFEPSGIAALGSQARQWNHPIPGSSMNPLQNISLPVHLEAGRAYYLEALAPASILGVNWRVPGQAAPRNGDPPIAGNFLAVLGNPQAATLTISEQPQDVSVAERQTAAFSVKATASPAFIYYQWRTNGAAIPGANGCSYITSETTLAENGVLYDCLLAVPGATATSRAALLTVTNDVTPPALVSAEGNLTGMHLTLTFSEPINVADATNTANYTLSGGLTVSNAVLLVDRKTVILRTSQQTPGSNYTIQVSGIRDCSVAGNSVAAGAEASFYGWVDEEFVGPFSSWANVKTDYGAVGDGVADDTAALQQALNQVATPGHAAVLYFPTGTYRITQTLNFGSRINATLAGEDPIATIIKWDGPTNADMMFANSVAFSRWTRLTWDGSGKALGGVHHGFTGGAYQVTSNVHTDEIFEDIHSALYSDPANGGDGHMIVRCLFLRCFNGIALGSYNALDWHVWDSIFKDCCYGLHAYVGSFHVYRSLFLRSTVADVHCADGYYGIRGNLSVGSKTFVEGSMLMTIQGNTVVDSLDPISVSGSSGPVILLDNTFRSRADVTNEPAVNVGANLLSAGNTFTVGRSSAVGGRSITLEDQVVDRDAFDLPPPMVPGFLPNRHRPVIEVPTNANAAVIQQAIDTAAGMNGLRPVVHLPAGNYQVDRTLVIPAGCDVQLVGDGFGEGFGSRGTGMTWIGPPGEPLLRLAGPSHATLREFNVYGYGSGSGIVIDNCDQPGARVFMESIYPNRSDVNLLVDRLDNTDVSLHDFEHTTAPLVSVKVIGGAAQAAGQPTRGRVDLFGGQSAGGGLTYQVERGGRLLVEDCWFEAGPGFMRLTDSGTLTLNNAQIAAGDEAHTHGGPNGAVELNDFHGQVTFLNATFTQTSALVKGDGSATDFLLLGCMGFPDNTPPKPRTYLDNQSPNAHVEHLLSNSSGLEIEDVGTPDPVFLRKMLAQVRTETPRRLTPLPVEVTDVRLFRIYVDRCRVGIKLTGTNATPQLAPMPAVYALHEETTLTFTNQVTDPDLPHDSFTFTLGAGAPTGINLNPTNGVFTWTPLESQGPQTNRLEIIVADDGSPRLFATNTFTVVVLESNQPPSLGITAIAPDDALQFIDFQPPAYSRAPCQWTLIAPGAIDAQVIDYGFAWGYGYDAGWFGYQDVTGDFDVRVRVESLEAVSGNTQAGLLVREEMNNPASRTLSCLLSAVGIALDGVNLGGGAYFPHYRPAAGAGTALWHGFAPGDPPYPNAWVRLQREGSTFSCYRSDDGVDWTLIDQLTPEPAYPGTVRVGICGASGSLQRAAEVRFRDYVNLVTKLPAPEPKVIDEGVTVSMEFGAHDPDVPRQALHFSLGTDAPEGATVDATNGVFIWTPTEAQVPSTNLLTVVVTDDGAPPLSATSSFTVIVKNTLPPLTVGLDSPSWTTDGKFRFHLAGPEGIQVLIQSSTNLADWEDVQTNRLIGGSAEYYEGEGLTFRQRYFRARLVP